ncbi:MAG TPA: hypothetical protein VGB69_03415 [Edaphobacter sp.]
MRLTLRNSSRFLFAINLCLLSQGYFIAAQTSTAEHSKPEAGKSIHQMFLDDQDDTPAGKPGGIAPISQAEIKVRGEQRRRLVYAMLAKGEVQTGEDLHDAALLFQHGESADDYLLAHILAVEAVIKGNDKSKFLAAATLDRYLQSVSKPQVFGTQYAPTIPVQPVTAAGNVGVFKGRTWTHMPIDEHLLPDAVRHDYCVPDLEQQKRNLATLNAGSYPGDAMVAPGCKR